MKFEPIRAAKYYYLKFIRLQGDPHFLARGVAVGIFIGITPTIPFHTVLTLGLAFLLRSSKIAALLLTVVVSNPLTFLFQYHFSLSVGNWITGKNLSWATINSFLDAIASHATFSETIAAFTALGTDTIIVLLVGGIFLAIPIALIGYFLSYKFFTLWQKQVMKKSSAIILGKKHNSSSSSISSNLNK